MKITIIGKGKLGRSVSYLLNKNSVKHSLLGRKVSYPCAGLVYICVPESQITTVARTITDADIVLHSSGSIGIEVLGNHKYVGCLHPIMTFPGPEIAMPEGEIPATFVGSTNINDHIRAFVTQLGFSLYPYSGAKNIYHSASVISGNFSTILLHAAATILAQEGVSYQDALKMVYPLALQSLQNAPRGTLHRVLTGPISRNETELLKEHIDALKIKNPELSELYKNFIQTYQAIIKINFTKT